MRYKIRDKIRAYIGVLLVIVVCTIYFVEDTINMFCLKFKKKAKRGGHDEK